MIHSSNIRIYIFNFGNGKKKSFIIFNIVEYCSLLKLKKNNKYQNCKRSKFNINNSNITKSNK